MQRHVNIVNTNIVNTNIVNTNPTMQGRQRKEELAHQFALCSTGTSVTTRCNHGLGSSSVSAICPTFLLILLSATTKR